MSEAAENNKDNAPEQAASPPAEKIASGRMVKLVSKDDQSFELPVEAATLSVLVKNSLNVEDEDGEGAAAAAADEEYKDVDLLRVSGTCLERVVEFLRHYHEEPMTEIPTPLGGSTLEEVMKQEWYQNFVSEESMERNMLFEVLTAANYMDIKPLLDLACLKVTFILKGKNAEEIRQILNLPKLTEEEEAQARRDHPWIFEDQN